MVLNLDKIASQYKKWFLSEPFEIENTIFNAVSPLLESPKSVVAKNAAVKMN